MNPQPDGLPNQLYGLGGRLLDLLFPPRCVNCKQVGSSLCERCLASIERPHPPLCHRCNHPLTAPAAVCLHCRTHPPLATRVLFSAWHEGAVREAIHGLKYDKRRDVVHPLAVMLANSFRSSPESVDWITCVPLHRARELERGYNQAELLARATAPLAGLPFAHVLERTRATADQIGLNPPARRENVQGAFRVNALPIAGKNVLLVDDVCTTGATLDACAEALFQAGAKHVYGLTVSRPRTTA